MVAAFSEKSRGKMRARDDGAGGASGIVLDLTLIDGSLPQSCVPVSQPSCMAPNPPLSAYALPVKIGSSTYSLQVDVGSSDNWVVGTACQTSDCAQSKNRYDPSSSQSTNQTFSLSYLKGNVSGPIVRDTFSLGGYSIGSQAFAAATDVNAEPLGPNFAGLLGLALPGNSIIKSMLGNGQTLPEGLFSSSNAPSAQFLSLSLERPGYKTVPSALGIGQHPSSLVPDPSKVHYTSLAGGTNSNFWNAAVSQLTVYVNGSAAVIPLAGSVGSFPSPTAALDSGVPVILTTRGIANAMYGAIGIGPAVDGNYYFPCTVAFNISMMLNGVLIPLHPLDTSMPTDQKDVCQGAIVADDAAFANDHAIGDFVLGVPFMRNVYSVLAYTPPDVNGAFATAKGSLSINPRLGLLALTDPTKAAQEWKTVRLHKSPPTLATPAIIGIIIGAIFVACGCIVLGRFLCLRRRSSKQAARGHVVEEWEAEKGRMNFARFHREDSGSGYALATLRDDTLRGTPGVGSPLSKMGSPRERSGSEYFPHPDTTLSGPDRDFAKGSDPSNDSTPHLSGGRPSEWGEGHMRDPSETLVGGMDRPPHSSHARRPSHTPLLEGMAGFTQPAVLDREATPHGDARG
jgi:hypothetical protein